MMHDADTEDNSSIIKADDNPSHTLAPMRAHINLSMESHKILDTLRQKKRGREGLTLCLLPFLSLLDLP